MKISKINTLGQLKKAGYQSKTVHEEIRDNLINTIRNK
jgi:magnesium chelatase subunit I